MTAHKAKCMSCGEEVTGELYHLGFGEMQALYCSSCPRVLLLKEFWLIGRRGIKYPNLQAHDPGFQFYNRHVLPYYKQVESMFKPCLCGGSFGYMNPPRCPSCNGLFRGDCYEDKPILKQNDWHVFVATEAVYDHQQVKPEYA